MDGQRPIVVRSLGLVAYEAGLEAQARAEAEVRDGARGIVLALRHPPSVTLGRRADECELHVDRWERRRLGVALFHVERGGGATWHHPGQAVVYPVLHVGRLGLTVAAMLEAAGRAVTGLLAEAGIDASWDAERPGAYVRGAKVASVGLRVSGEVTTHGLALNVRASSERGFAFIDPCKCPGLAVTSMERMLGRAPDPDRVAIDLATRLIASLAALHRAPDAEGLRRAKV